MSDIPENEKALPTKNVNIDLTELSGSVVGQYEKRPYPAEDERVLSDRGWKLAPLHWWTAVGFESQSLPPNPRILIAGCGTGNEAFTCARTIKGSEVIGVDFSPRSIEIAEKWKVPSDLDNVHFMEGDLASEGLPEKLGGKFDLISCHGVATYIPNIEKVLENFQKCLREDGSIYLGVNGSGHLSTRYRHLLKAYGMNPDLMGEPARSRDIISMGDGLCGLPQGKGMSRHSDSYIASDIFGYEMNNRTLAEWIALAEGAGLQFLGNFSTVRSFANLNSAAQIKLAMEKSPAELHALADAMKPNSFLRIILGNKERRLPSFKAEDREDLLQWRPFAAMIKRGNIPEQSKPFNRRIEITIDIPGIYQQLKMNLTTYLLEFIRRSDGETSIEEIMAEIDFKTDEDELVMLICRMYLMGLLQMCQPKS